MKMRSRTFGAKTMGALSNPFDPNQIALDGLPVRAACLDAGTSTRADEWVTPGSIRALPNSRFFSIEGSNPAGLDERAGEQASRATDDRPATADVAATSADADPDWDDQEAVLARCVESAVMKGLFGTDMNRRALPARGRLDDGARRNLPVHPARQGQGGHRRCQGTAGEEEAQCRLRADHLRDADHHGPPDGLLQKVRPRRRHHQDRRLGGQPRQVACPANTTPRTC